MADILKTFSRACARSTCGREAERTAMGNPLFAPSKQEVCGVETRGLYVVNYGFYKPSPLIWQSVRRWMRGLGMISSVSAWISPRGTFDMGIDCGKYPLAELI